MDCAVSGSVSPQNGHFCICFKPGGWQLLNVGEKVLCGDTEPSEFQVLCGCTCSVH